MMASPLRQKIHELVDFVDTSGDGDRNFDYYDVFMLVVIVLSLVPLVFKEETPFLRILDLSTAIVFIIDYVLRWIVADYSSKRDGAKAFLLYPFTPMAIVDLVSILPSLSALGEAFKLFRIFRMLRIVRTLRALRVVRVAKLARYSKSLQIIGRVLKNSREALLAVCAFAGAYILVSALIIFNVEPDAFNSFFEAVYWATVSLTTVGYGDIYPVTVIGRIVAMVSSVFGIAIVALPAGIITAGYMSELRKDDIDTKEEIADRFKV